ncbi:MAG: phospholipase, partial [Candidatus Latescibacterota bacterium]
VVSTDMAKDWKLWAKWGHSCDLRFDAEEFLRKHPQYEWLNGHLADLPTNPWTIFPGDDER